MIVVASLSSLLLHVILSPKVVHHILEWISCLHNQDKCQIIIIKGQSLHVTFIKMNKETVIYKWLYGNYPCNTTRYSPSFQCVVDEKWGDWRPHLAMILSNPTGREMDKKSIMTLGDTLGNSTS